MSGFDAARRRAGTALGPATQLEYDLRFPDGRILQVWSVPGGFYDGWMAVVNGEVHPVTNVHRYRDGGTTEIIVDGGMLRVPAPNKWLRPESREPITYIRKGHRPLIASLTRVDNHDDDNDDDNDDNATPKDPQP